MAAVLEKPDTKADLRWMREHSRPPRRRGLLEFAESEFVLPDGPYKGERFRRHVQPAAGLFMDEMDRGRWRRFAFTGPRQGGKTTAAYVVPILHALFEMNETVVLGVPDIQLANDKWRIDLLPAIESSRFAMYLPVKGAGSRGGQVESSVKFTNGTTLKFMTGGGGDASRSGFTTRVAFVTEADKLDVVGGTSRESDKITQIFGTTGAYGDDAIQGLESTASYSWGRIWREYQAGTCSSIFCPCPHCRAWVCPGRESLTGWRDAESSGDAEDRAAWCCPACGEVISETQRAAMNRAGVLVHKGQKVEWADGSDRNVSSRPDERDYRKHDRTAGDRRGTGDDAHAMERVEFAHCSGKPVSDWRICGDRPATRTLGFRFDAFNNLFWDARYVAAREWAAANAPDEANGEKEIKQFVWALPYDPPELDANKLIWQQIAKRQRETPRGQAPDGTLAIVVTADPGKYNLHWIATALVADGTTHVVDYGVVDVPSGSMEVLQAVLSALRNLREMIAPGFAVAGRDGPMFATTSIVDAGNWDDAVYEFVRESPGWYASKGFACTKYNTPKIATENRASWVGVRAHAVRFATKGVFLVEFDADHWKTAAHGRLSLPVGTEGAMTLFNADFREHTALAKHCLAEEPMNEFHGGSHAVRWKPRGSTAAFLAKKANHFWDCLVLAGVAAEIADVHAEPVAVKRREPSEPKEHTRGRRDGRPWLLRRDR